MSLDINTEKGQKSLEDEREASAIIAGHFKVQLFETPKEIACPVDGFIVKYGIIKSFYELKCRYDMNDEGLKQRGSWLISYDKIRKGRELSAFLGIPFIGFLYLIPNQGHRDLYYCRIAIDGVLQFEIKTEQTKTQETINGGEANRWNTFIPYENLKKIQ